MESGATEESGDCLKSVFQGDQLEVGQDSGEGGGEDQGAVHGQVQVPGRAGKESWGGKLWDGEYQFLICCCCAGNMLQCSYFKYLENILIIKEF